MGSVTVDKQKRKRQDAAGFRLLGFTRCSTLGRLGEKNEIVKNGEISLVGWV